MRKSGCVWHRRGHPIRGRCLTRTAGLVGVGLLTAVLATPAHAQRLNESAVSGRILSLGDDQPIPQAGIRLNGTELVVLSDASGLFRMDRVPPGEYLLQIERLGYATREEWLSVPPGTVVDVTVHLAIEPIELEPLEMVIRSLVLERAGFYTRQTQGFGGHFMDRTRIMEENPSQMTDLFRAIPGIRISYGGIYGSRVFVNQRVTFSDDAMGCEPTVWLDGIRSTMRSYDVMRTDELEGVEVYAGGGPGKFNDVCGSILIWTRLPMRR